MLKESGMSSKEDFLTHAALSFEFFVEHVMRTDEEKKILLKDFHREWIKAIEENNRVAVVAPTGHGKSLCLCVCYICWLLAFRRNIHVLLITNIDTNAKMHLSRIKSSILANEFLLNLMPHAHRKTWSKSEIETTNGGRVYIRACTENVQGIHVNLIVADEVAQFDKQVYYGPITTRVNAKKGKIIAISTPSTETDLIMELTSPNSGYVGFRYSACELDDEDNIIPESILFPEKFSVEYLNTLRQPSEHAFSLQYLCNPVPRGSALVSRESLIASYDDNRRLMTAPITGERYWIGVDFAIRQHKPQAATVAIVVKEEGDKIVIAHAVRMKGMGQEAQEDVLEQLYKTWQPYIMNVDSSTFGAGFAEELTSRGCLIKGIPFHPEQRMKLLMNLARLFETKKIVLPHDLTDPTTSRYITQLIKELDRMVWGETKSPTFPKTTIKSVGTTSDMVMALCYDDRTRVLTKNGWKKFKDVEVGEQVLSLNKDADIEYATVNRVIDEEYNGKMVHFLSKSIDLLVTPNHRMVVVKDKKRGLWDVDEAQNLIGKHFRLFKGGRWYGKRKKFFRIPEVDYDIFHKYLIKRNWKIETNLFLEFLGYYISEGSSNGKRIHIAQLKKSKAWKPIRKCLDRLGVKYHICKDGFWINNKQLASFIKTLVPKLSYEKKIPREILELGSVHLKHLFRAMMLGDGYKMRIYVTASPYLKDDMIELAHKIGYFASAYVVDNIGRTIFGDRTVRHKEYYISINKGENNTTPEFNHHKRYGATCYNEAYSGRVHCLELDRNNNMLVMRNGKTVWSGNSLSVFDYQPQRRFVSKIYSS